MISVMMPVYNAEKYIKKSIESILNQTEKDLELVIVNDGSTDKSENIILSIKDPRIIYLKQDNGGEAVARNTALKHISGDYVTFQDADDISLPMRLEVLKRHFTISSIGFVHSDFLLINEFNEPLGYWSSENIEPVRLPRFFLKHGTPFNNPSMMVRREVLQGFQYDTTLRLGNDTDMVFRTTTSWATVHVPQPLLLYRRHADSLSHTKDYATLFLHVQKYLDSHSLEKLIPELNWEKGDNTNNQARAKAIIALFLLRRGMVHDCQRWYYEAGQLINSTNEKFVYAIGHMLAGNYGEAISNLESYPVQDAVTINYLGESYALQGNLNKAYENFLRALQMNPKYEEPLDNLKAIGWVKGLSYINGSWTKFS
ncbi:hypothetical protein JCM14036_28380 [Desulfotomaculum defluvii]